MLLLGAALPLPSVTASRSGLGQAHPEGRTARVQGECLPKAGSCGLRGDSRGAGGIAASPPLALGVSSLTSQKGEICPRPFLSSPGGKALLSLKLETSSDGSLADAWAWEVGRSGGTGREEPDFS